jgi:hypothetical protein
MDTEPLHDFADFIKWLGETRRTISAPGTMCAEFHLPSEAKDLTIAYLTDRSTQKD